MSAERLREAAALMRERADIPWAGGGAWEASGAHIRKTSSSPRFGWPSHAEATICLYDEQEETRAAIATHIASWHPAVALSVADWLDACADRLYPGVFNEDDLIFAPALAVANAYLGGDD